jgi:hypothetical protein
MYIKEENKSILESTREEIPGLDFSKKKNSSVCSDSKEYLS